MATNLTQECIDGYKNADQTDWRDTAPANPFIWSSAAWMAFEAGEALGRHGVTAPRMASKSRGYSVKIRTQGGADYLYRLHGDDLDIVELTRLS